MDPITATVIGAILSLAGGLGGGLVVDFNKEIVRHLRGSSSQQPNTYGQRLKQLMEELHQASSEVDNVLAELAEVTTSREEAVSSLETTLQELEQREQRLQQRIDTLRDVPLPVAEHFASLTAEGERRSARRDYLLFGAGVVVSTPISIIFFLLGGV